MLNQPFRLIYIDAFAGSGTWQPSLGYAPEDYGEYTDLLKGSASRALDTSERPFDRLIFIEQNQDRSTELRTLSEQHIDRDIEVISDDANQVLPRLCKRMDPFDRAVVFLDPYATQVAWGTIESIARTKQIDCWILFPLMAIARMMPRAKMPHPSLEPRLNRLFGDPIHWKGIYREPEQLSYFNTGPSYVRESGSDQIADSYRKILEGEFTQIAPLRRTLRNSNNGPLFELFFGASNPTGAKTAVRIANHILRNW